MKIQIYYQVFIYFWLYIVHIPYGLDIPYVHIPYGLDIPYYIFYVEYI